MCFYMLGLVESQILPRRVGLVKFGGQAVDFVGFFRYMPLYGGIGLSNLTLYKLDFLSILSASKSLILFILYILSVVLEVISLAEGMRL